MVIIVLSDRCDGVGVERRIDGGDFCERYRTNKPLLTRIIQPADIAHKGLKSLWRMDYRTRLLRLIRIWTSHTAIDLRSVQLSRRE